MRIPPLGTSLPGTVDLHLPFMIRSSFTLLFALAASAADPPRLPAGQSYRKKMLAEIKAVPVKSRVRLEWTFEERPRVEKIEVLKKPESEKKK